MARVSCPTSSPSTTEPVTRAQYRCSSGRTSATRSRNRSRAFPNSGGIIAWSLFILVPFLDPPACHAHIERARADLAARDPHDGLGHSLGHELGAEALHEPLLRD